MKPWEKQELGKKSIPTIAKITEIANGIKNKRTKCLFALLYLTGARIGEVVRKTGYDVNSTFNEIKNEYCYNKLRNDNKNLPSIIKKQLKFEKMNGRDILLIELRNEKNLNEHTKSIPIPLDNKEYVILVEMVKEYLSTLEMESELFPFNYQYAYRLLKPYFNPHWFRHIRATHLTLNNDLPGPLLRKYMGWSDDRPATNYLELNSMDILDRL